VYTTARFSVVVTVYVHYGATTTTDDDDDDDNDDDDVGIIVSNGRVDVDIVISAREPAICCHIARDIPLVGGANAV
jgi:hypothetical protein